MESVAQGKAGASESGAAREDSIKQEGCTERGTSMVRELTCIGCPLGCRLRAYLSEKGVEKVEGNTCPRGEAYAREELTAPKRMVSTTVRMADGGMLPVRTAAPIPKGKVMDCVRQLGGVRVSGPVEMGQIIVADVAGTGVNLVAADERGA